MNRPVALVTGGSGGIGTACVRELATDHDLAIHYHSNREGAEESAEMASTDGADTALLQADLSDRSAVTEMVGAAVEEFGRLDRLVNNASLFLQTGVLEMEPDEISKTLSVNLEGTIYCTRAALPSLVENDGGRIITIGSTAGVEGSPTDPVYGASKGGVIAFTRSIARQFTEEGVFANVVAPGPTDTSMFAMDRRPAKRESSPIGRLVKPEEVADAVRFFADTSSISGRVLVVDGGDIT